MRRSESSRDRGFVTAETAVVVPSLVLLMAMLLWGVMAAVAKVQCVDAARAGARTAARGESGEAVARVVRSVAPSGASVEVTRDGEMVRVLVQAQSPGPGPLALSLRARAVALAENTVASPTSRVPRSVAGAER